MPVAWVVGGEGPTTRGRAGAGHSEKGRGQMGGRTLRPEDVPCRHGAWPTCTGSGGDRGRRSEPAWSAGRNTPDLRGMEDERASSLTLKRALRTERPLSWKPGHPTEEKEVHLLWPH